MSFSISLLIDMSLSAGIDLQNINVIKHTFSMLFIIMKKKNKKFLSWNNQPSYKSCSVGINNKWCYWS